MNSPKTLKAIEVRDSVLGVDDEGYDQPGRVAGRNDWLRLVRLGLTFVIGRAHREEAVLIQLVGLDNDDGKYSHPFVTCLETEHITGDSKKRIRWPASAFGQSKSTQWSSWAFEWGLCSPVCTP